MFEKLKQFKDLRDRAKSMQSILSEVVITNEHKGITLTMDGNQQVKSAAVRLDMTAEEIQRQLPEAINQIIKKTQRAMVEKMQASGGLDKYGL